MAPPKRLTQPHCQVRVSPLVTEQRAFPRALHGGEHGTQKCTFRAPSCGSSPLGEQGVPAAAATLRWGQTSRARGSKIIRSDLKRALGWMGGPKRGDVNNQAQDEACS